MKKRPNYHKDLMDHLKNPAHALGFLNACLENPDKRLFLLGLKDVAEAQGGMTKLARLSNISREHIYRMLSKKGNPEWNTLQLLLEKIGFKLTLLPNKQIKKAA